MREHFGTKEIMRGLMLLMLILHLLFLAGIGLCFMDYFARPENLYRSELLYGVAVMAFWGAVLSVGQAALMLMLWERVSRVEKVVVGAVAALPPVALAAVMMIA